MVVCSQPHEHQCAHTDSIFSSLSVSTFEHPPFWVFVLLPLHILVFIFNSIWWHVLWRYSFVFQSLLKPPLVPLPHWSDLGSAFFAVLFTQSWVFLGKPSRGFFLGGSCIKPDSKDFLSTDSLASGRPGEKFISTGPCLRALAQTQRISPVKQSYNTPPPQKKSCFPDLRIH